MKPQEKKTFDKFYDRLKIGWFGVLTTPHFDDMEKRVLHRIAFDYAKLL